MIVSLISYPMFYLKLFLLAVIKKIYGEESCALFGGWVKQKFVINQDFLPRQTFWYFHWQDISSCFLPENKVTVLRSTEERVAKTSRLSVKRNAPPRLPPSEGPFLKEPYLWRYGTHLHKMAILQLKITQVSENGVLLPRKNIKVCEQVRPRK